MEIAEEEFKDWKQHRVTQEITRMVTEELEFLDSQWRPNIGDGFEAIAIEQSFRMGKIEAYQEILDLNPKGDKK